jgi:thiamine-phosphate pyrophosphorylase
MAMRRRQTVPLQWLIVESDGQLDAEDVRRLPRGAGVLLLFAPSAALSRRLRQVARQKKLTVVAEHPRAASRVHDMRELRRALQRRTPLILLSPIHRTSSHPDWSPMPRMRAAALARLGGRQLVALGGMNARRFAHVKQLGFQAWAGISAFRT